MHSLSVVTARAIPRSGARVTEPAAEPGSVAARERVAWWLALASSLALVAALFARVPIWPTHDGPQHLLMAHIEGHFADPAQHYDRYFVEAPQFAGRGFTAWYVPLEGALGPVRAGRVAPALVVLLSALCSALFFRAVHPGRAWLGIAAVPLAFSWAFYMGFYPFCVTTALGSLLLAGALRVAQTPAERRPRNGVLAVAAAGSFAALGVSHVVSAAFVAAVFGALFIALYARDGTLGPASEDSAPAGPWPRNALRGALTAAALAAPVLVLLVLTSLVAAQHNTTQGTHAASYYAPAFARLASLGRMYAPGPHLRGALVLACALAGAAYQLARWRTSRPVDRALGLVGAAMLLLGWVAPTDLPAWDFFSQRFLPLGALCGLASLPLERLAPAARVAASLAACAALAWWPAQYQHSLRDRLGDAWSGLYQNHQHAGPRFLASFEPLRGFDRDLWRHEVPGLMPLAHLCELYASVEGGTCGTMYRGHAGAHAQLDAPRASEGAPRLLDPLYHIVMADPSRPPSFRASLVELHAGVGTTYDDVILLGRPDDHLRFMARGYEFTYRNDRLALGRFEGCSLSVAVRGDGAAAVEAIDVGWYPLTDVRFRVPLELEGAERRALFARAPCGVVWVQPSRGRCSDAQPIGRSVRVLRNTRETQPLVCELVAGPGAQ